MLMVFDTLNFLIKEIFYRFWDLIVLIQVFVEAA